MRAERTGGLFNFWYKPACKASACDVRPTDTVRVNGVEHHVRSSGNIDLSKEYKSIIPLDNK